MKYQVLFSLKNVEEIFMNVVCGVLRVKVICECYLSVSEYFYLFNFMDYV